MIAREQERKNMRYANMNAYSNEMYNTNMPFSEVYQELRLPVRTIRPQRAYMTDYDGGITHRNMEGDGGVLRGMMRPAVLSEDVRPVGMGFADIMRPPKRIGKGSCCMHSRCSCMEGGMDREEEMKGMEGMEDDDEEEDDPELAGIVDMVSRLPTRQLPVRFASPARRPASVGPASPITRPRSAPASAPMPKPQASRNRGNKRKAEAQTPTPTPSPSQSPSAMESAFPSSSSPPAEDKRMTGPPSKKKGKGKVVKHSKAKHLKAFIAEMSSKTGRKPAELKKDAEVMKEFEEVHQKFVGSGMSGGFLPFLASIALPFLAKKVIGAFSGKKEGGAILGGPANDPVNGKKMGGRAKNIGEPQGTDTAYMPSTGLHYEGATLGAGSSGGAVVAEMPKKKGRGKGKKTGSSLFKTAPIVPLDVKSGVPPTEEQIEGISNIVEVPTGLGKKTKKSKKEGGMLKGLMPGSTFSGGKAKREPNAWIKHVQAYAKANKVSYKDAIKQARASYKKM
jgi:hypothetical protein